MARFMTAVALQVAGRLLALRRGTRGARHASVHGPCAARWPCRCKDRSAPGNTARQGLGAGSCRPWGGIVNLRQKIARLCSKVRTLGGFVLSRTPGFSLLTPPQIFSRERCLGAIFNKLTMLYHNFVLPHASRRQALLIPELTNGRGAATAVATVHTGDGSRLDGACMVAHRGTVLPGTTVAPAADGLKQSVDEGSWCRTAGVCSDAGHQGRKRG